ncbi:MAG TPA: SPOR domain-containing protein [Chitinophagaceae bacterium]|jgi:hypothetical protein|nr:SPOR domain-containing protein [Chitinophagaceae bacterium]HMU57097.1 SPOR domain-containing protein [Chitinophagaceae bacterium]
MKILFSIFLLLTSATLFGQNLQKLATDTTGNNVDSGSVIVHKDARLDLLVKKQAEINEATTRESRRTDKGFRLLIISTNSREEAIAAKTKVYSTFPELKAYLWHQSPYYKVKAGNFKDRKDAETYQRKLNPFFPKGVFIMKDVIEVKPGKENETED